VAGSADELRAKAYLDLLLDIDSRPAAQAAGGTHDAQDPDDDSDGPFGPGLPDPSGPRTPPGAGVIPAGFIGRNHLTVPLANLADRAARPGEIPGTGPVDPDPEANTPDRYRTVAWHWSIPGSASIRLPSSEY
jgi:hypothetical protein